MKKIMRTFALMAVAALGLSACTGEKLVPDNGNADGKFVTVHFGAEAAIEGATKATLTTEDEKTFKSAWENGDALSVEYISPETADNKIITATWGGTSFEAKGLPNETGAWDYTACYPKPDEKDNHIDFGRVRTQKGSAYNSIYDVMIGNKSTKNSAAGKDDDGSNVVFNMTRQTAVAYFHLTGGPADEKVVSATLSVEGGFIASQYAYISDFAFAPTKDLTDIIITFDAGTAPEASDFQLWYNVLPTSYTKMTLTVETTGHTMTISRNAPEKDEYLAGKLYKVVKEIPAEKWVSKAAYTGGDLVFDFKTIKPKGWPTTKEEANVAGTYKYAINGVDYNYLLGDGTYCGGTVPTSAYLMIAKGSSLGLPAIAGYKLVKVVGTLNDSGSPSKKSSISITDGTNEVIGGAAQTWDTMGSDYTYSLTETEENTVYYLSVSSTANCQMIKLVLSYEPATPSATKYVVSYATVEGGSFSASSSRAEAGAEITLTATPAEGYAFNNNWSVKGADETVIEVVDGKFTMPAQNVTVSGTFSKVAYTIAKAAAENGSFTVKNGTEEVTTAFKGDKLTLEAIPAEGFTFGKWTVTYMDGETEKSFNPSANTFNMPAANVTVSATFVETAAVPVYASVAELIAAGKPTEKGTKVTVTLKDEEIIRFHTLKDGTVAGAIIKVGTQEVEIFCKGTPSNWKIGGTISGTLTNCDWMLFYSTWELCPADYSELTYKAPLPTCATPVITIAEDGVVSITCDTAGATIHYTVGDTPADPTEDDAVFSEVTLTDGQTIKAIAVAEGYKPSAVASEKYTVGGEAPKTWTYALSGTDDPKLYEGNPATVNEATWSIKMGTKVGSPTTNGTPTKYSKIFGWKWGDSKDKYWSSYTLSTDYFASKKVKSVTVNFLNNGSMSATMTVKQGETTIGVATQTFGTKWTNLKAETTQGTGGTLTINYSVAQASYIHSITVEYYE